LSSADIEAILAIAPTIRGYQFVQKEPDLIEARLAAPPLTAEEEDQLAGWIESKFSHPFRVRFTYFTELPRTAAGKFEDFLCEVKA
jgi:phenylacetate-CoA ligase